MEDKEKWNSLYVMKWHTRDTKVLVLREMVYDIVHQ